VRIPCNSGSTSEPRYQDLRGAAMPVRELDGARLRVFSGSSGDVQGPALNHVPVTMIEMHLDAGATVRQELPATYNAFLYVIDGNGRFGKERQTAQAGQVVWFTAEEGEVVLEADSAMHSILYAGAPLREPVASQGPFVMNTVGELRQAFLDYQSGKF
jgi:redox-sensitive bicupin YhaK (pirin superfamily)